MKKSSGKHHKLVLRREAIATLTSPQLQGVMAGLLVAGSNDFCPSGNHPPCNTTGPEFLNALANRDK
jgi:hypothetical protein